MAPPDGKRNEECEMKDNLASSWQHAAGTATATPISSMTSEQRAALEACGSQDRQLGGMALVQDRHRHLSYSSLLRG